MDKDLIKYVTHVKGESKGHVFVYTLSNCAWCRKTKQLLNTMGVEYSYIDADLVERKDRQKLMETIEKWNPACIFPTVIINETCINDSDEYTIRAMLNQQHTT